MKKIRIQANTMSLAKALTRDYLVRENKSGDGHSFGRLNLPKCLIGKRIKIILTKEVNDACLERRKV